jgi:hypothetical protein
MTALHRLGAELSSLVDEEEGENNEEHIHDYEPTDLEMGGGHDWKTRIFHLVRQEDRAGGCGGLGMILWLSPLLGFREVDRVIKSCVFCDRLVNPLNNSHQSTCF